MIPADENSLTDWCGQCNFKNVYFLSQYKASHNEESKEEVVGKACPGGHAQRSHRCHMSNAISSVQRFQAFNIFAQMVINNMSHFTYSYSAPSEDM